MAVSEQMRSRRATTVLFAGEALLAAGLGMALLATKSFSNDEGTNAIWTGDGWRALFEVIRHVDANMSFYDFFQKLWRVFGDSEVVLRLPSVVAAALSVFVVAKLAERLFGTRTGLVAGLAFATGRMLVEAAQNARSYGMLVLLTAVATYAFVVAVERGGRWPWIVFTAATVLGIHAHFFAVLVLLAQLVSLAFSNRSLRSLRPLVVSVATAGVICVPLALAVRSTGIGSISWIRTPTAHTVRITLEALGAGGGRSAVLGVFLVVAGVAFVRVLRARGRGEDAWRLGLVWSWLVVPLVITLAVALTVKPIWVSRYLVIELAPLAIVAAYGITRIADWRLVTGVTVVLALLGVPTLLVWYRSHPADFRAATAAVLDRMQPGDGIVFCGDWVRRPFEYYADRHTGPRPDPISPPERWGDAALLDEQQSHAELRAALASYRRVWLVSWAGGPESFFPAACTDTRARTLFARDYHTVGVRLVEPAG